MTKQQRDVIRARCEAATPDVSVDVRGGCVGIRKPNIDSNGLHPEYCTAFAMGTHRKADGGCIEWFVDDEVIDNFTFYAAARSDVPELLNTADQLENEVDQLRTALRAAANSLDAASDKHAKHAQQILWDALEGKDGDK